MVKSKKSQSQGQPNLDLTSVSTSESVFDAHDDTEDVFTMAVTKILDCGSTISEWCQNETSSSVLQSLLSVLAKLKDDGKLCKKLAKFLTNEVFAEESSDIFEHEPSLRLMETLVQVSGTNSSLEKISNHYWTTFFKDNLMDLCKHPLGKISVQKFLQSCTNKERFEEIYEKELDANMGELIQYPGIMFAISQSCNKLKAKQAHFMVVSLITDEYFNSFLK